MSSLKKAINLIRPVQCCTAMLATFVVANWSSPTPLFASEKITAAICMFLLVLASSLYHYITVMPNLPYTRKIHDQVTIKSSHWLFWLFLASAGIIYSIFVVSLLTEVWYITIGIVVAGALVGVYPKVRGIYGPPANMLTAVVCAVPVFVGWHSGHSEFSSTALFLFALTFITYLLREDLKDLPEKYDKPTILECLFDGEKYFPGAVVFWAVINIMAGMFFISHLNLSANYLLLFAGAYLLLTTIPFLMYSKKSFHSPKLITATAWCYMTITILPTI